MKKLIVFLLSLMAVSAFSGTSDTIQAESEIKEVTVFFSGAQVSRQVDLNAEKGEYLLMIDNLPFEINPQSIQVESMEHCKILSVNHQMQYSTSNEKTDEILAVEEDIKNKEFYIKELMTKNLVFDLEEELLLDNSKLAVGESGSKISEIKEAADFYRSRLGEIKQEKLLLGVMIDEANDEMLELYTKLNELTVDDRTACSQVLIRIDCVRAIDASMLLRYYIPSAGWEPIYDFRVEDISEPLTIVYNANVYQTSGEDWDNIDIILSTSNPALSGEKPDLGTLYVGESTYSSYQPVQVQYQEQAPGHGTGGSLSGGVFDRETREELPFVNIVLEQNGQQMGGASSDIYGKYIIKPITPGRYDVRASFIGYNEVIVRNIQINANQIRFYDIEMQSSHIGLEEVVIVDYKVPLINKDNTVSGGGIAAQESRSRAYNNAGSSSSSSYRSSRKEARPEVVTRSNIAYTSGRKVTNLEYNIEIPYTIPSDGEEYGIKIKEVDIPVEYVHYAVPKLDPDAFLTANVIDWAELDLLDGESSIYYQGTFVGQSFINSKHSSDTLSVSLGRDNDVFVKREGNKELNDRRVIGSNIKETIAWDITLRNNKATPTTLILEDQYPLSERKSIVVELLESSSAKVDVKTGKLIWELELQPNEKKLIQFKYSVKYPKYMQLYLE